MKIHLLYGCALGLIISTPVSAEDSSALQGRAEVNWRYGHERSILMSEFWVPFAQDGHQVLYGDLRMMGDDQSNREGNLGLGYRAITTLPLIDTKGVAGVHGWLDRRITEQGSTFHQGVVGVEWLGESMDLRVNGYLPFSDEQIHTVPNADPQGPALAGTGIVVDTEATLLEEPQHGFDIELGLELGPHFDFARDHTDSFRLYGGGYYFNGPNTERVSGWRTRIAADVTPNIQIGGRFQRDNIRGSQGFLEATLRFPFGHKKSYRREGLRARLDESPERDIDIVTGAQVTDPGDRVPVINKEIGAPQEVLNVDNTAAAGGDGSAERPFSTLSDAEAAASQHTIIYVSRGDGTSTGQNQGITLDKKKQQLLGSGVNFIYDSDKFSAANGGSPTSFVIAPAGPAPVIGNDNADGDGITIIGDDITVAGLTVDGASRDGIVVRADGTGASAQNAIIRDVSAINNRIGIYIHGTNVGAASAKVERALTTANNQHGIAVYDDTDNTFEVDLGGGTLGSLGRNILAGNGLEDLAVEYDGRTLAAMNNWWGQASGPDTDNPDIGTRPQIYYGAPFNDGLVGHWTFDTEWTDGAQIYDRTALSLDGDRINGPTSLTGQRGKALEFDGDNDYVEVARNAALEPASAITASAWVNWKGPASGDYQKILNKAKDTFSGPYQSYSLSVNDNTEELEFEVNVNGALRKAVASIDAPLDTWVFVTGTWESGDRIKIYYDDQEVGTSAVYSGSITYYDSPFAIGHSSNGEEPTTNFDGVVDDARIYDRVLSPSEISKLYRTDSSSVVDMSHFMTEEP